MTSHFILILVHVYTCTKCIHVHVLSGYCVHIYILTDQDIFWPQSHAGDVEGFPLSSCLKSLGAHLGRTARMLACQSIHKIKQSTSGSALQSVFYRAVLQVSLYSS